MYLGNSRVGSTYGAAGSFVVILLWVYYSAQILFFGVEFTQVYANKYGSRIEPAPNAVPVTEEARAQQGIPRTGNVEALAQQPSGSRHSPPTAGEPTSPPPNSQRPSPHPAAILLSLLIGAYQGLSLIHI